VVNLPMAIESPTPGLSSAIAGSAGERRIEYGNELHVHPASLRLGGWWWTQKRSPVRAKLVLGQVGIHKARPKNDLARGQIIERLHRPLAVFLRSSEEFVQPLLDTKKAGRELHPFAEILPLEGVPVREPILVLVGLLPRAGRCDRFKIVRIGVVGLPALHNFVVGSVGQRGDYCIEDVVGRAELLGEDLFVGLAFGAVVDLVAIGVRINFERLTAGLVVRLKPSVRFLGELVDAHAGHRRVVVVKIAITFDADPIEPIPQRAFFDASRAKISVVSHSFFRVWASSPAKGR
jgi:hypothetical protein